MNPVRNPIDRRHVNRKGTRCPMFWRRFGNGLALFFALFPWIVFALLAAWSALGAGVTRVARINSPNDILPYLTIADIMGSLLIFTLVLWVLQLVPTLVFWWMMEGEATNGAVEKRRCHLCMLIWLAGVIVPIFGYRFL